MGLPRITYNSKNIDFAVDVYRQQLSYPRAVTNNRAVSGVFETLNLSSECLVQLAFRWLTNANATDAGVKRQLYQFAEWAMQGKPWTFARDSAKTGNTTLSAGAASGATTLTVSSITGFASGDLCILRSTTQLELIKINGAPSGSTITLTDTLNFDYASGSRFRAEMFWPARLIGNTPPVQERPPLHFDVELAFMEDMN